MPTRRGSRNPGTQLPFLSLVILSSPVPARVCRPLAIAVTVVDPLDTALAMGGTGQAFDLQLHQALRSKRNHLAQEIGVRVLLQKAPGGSSCPWSSSGPRYG